MLDWSQERLAAKSGVSMPTIQRLEAQDGPLGGGASTGEKIRETLEAAGIEFTNGDAPGVRLNKKRRLISFSHGASGAMFKFHYLSI